MTFLVACRGKWWRGDDLKVSALGSGVSWPGSSHDRGTLLSQSQDEIAWFRISETWRKRAIPWFRYIYVWRKRENSSATWFRHVSETEMPSQVSAIFKLADFRYCSFPSCFCKWICSCLLYLPKHKREMVPWTTMNRNILPVGDKLQLQPQEVSRLTLRKVTNIRQYEESALRKGINKHCTAGNK